MYEPIEIAFEFERIDLLSSVLSSRRLNLFRTLFIARLGLAELSFAADTDFFFDNAISGHIHANAVVSAQISE